jgi:ABC-type antimicrobial peptide transport system permease subunit
LAGLLAFVVKDMRHDLGRTLLTVTGLAVIVFCYFLLTALADSVFEVSSGVSSNLILVEAGMIDPSDSNVDFQAVQAIQEAAPSLINRISPALFRHMRVGGRVVVLRAAPVTDWESIYHLSLLEGNWPLGAGEVAVEEGLARAGGWRPRSMLEIYGSPFYITGIFRSSGMVLASVWIPLEAAQDLFAPRREYQSVTVQVAPGADVEAVRSRLQNDPRLGDRYTVFLEDSYTRRNNQVYRDLNALGLVLGTIALLAVILGSYTVTQLSLAERSREIGILRALGFSRRAVSGILVVRALLQGLLAFAAGLAAAWAYTVYRQRVDPVIVLGYSLTMTITLRHVLAGLAWTSAWACLGAWLSTRGMAMVSAGDLLRD